MLLFDAEQTVGTLGCLPPSLHRPICRAFVGSIGILKHDGAGAAAEHLGVIADPEITEHRLSPEAPLLILASDGVFEFLSNQSVVDMVSQLLLSVWMLALWSAFPPKQLS